MENKESKFHCSAEWHLAQMLPLCAPVYAWSWRIAKSGRFSVSEIHAMEYFGCGRTTMVEVYKQLRESGFFRLIHSGKEEFESSIYEPISHDKWAKAYPGRCLQKEPDLTILNNDPLGKDLYAASGAKIKVKDFQIARYRRLGFADYDVVEHFKEWLPKHEANQKGKKWRNAVGFHFGQYLEALSRSSLGQAPPPKVTHPLVTSLQ